MSDVDVVVFLRELSRRVSRARGVVGGVVPGWCLLRAPTDLAGVVGSQLVVAVSDSVSEVLGVFDVTGMPEVWPAGLLVARDLSWMVSGSGPVRWWVPLT